jgi:hypothetical protein
MPRSRGRPLKACCMISEILEESGIDRERARQLRRQVLEGVILLCRWQLERMEEPQVRARAARPRRVPVE